MSDRPEGLRPGLYEQVVNREISDELQHIPEERKSTDQIDSAEAPSILSHYLERIMQQKLDDIAESGGDLSDQIDLANQIIEMIRPDGENAGAAADASKRSAGQPLITPSEGDVSPEAIDPGAEQLRAILGEKDPMLLAGKKASDLPRPETSIAEDSLFTGSRHEPQLYTELKKEIASCQRIDMLVSFIKFSGLRLILDDLRRFTRNGGALRVITTSYMGATDIKAVKELSRLPNTEIHVSYNTKSTRLHAKSYIFYRETGFTTAYIGSSNLSSAALTKGLEWNMKVTAKSQPEILRKISATFESYWNSSEFEVYRPDNKEDTERLAAALQAEKITGSADGHRVFFDVRPYPFQQQILDQLEAEREVRGEYKNLVVAATGTGKTMIAAFDYRNYRRKHPERPGRLLFVAHREEILKQAQYSFQEVLKDPNFGELYVGDHRPEKGEDLFASIQTINARALYDHLPADYFDYIVVDEFHHAAAPTYQKLLGFFRPQILLGLTATPERMDGKSILDYFDQHCAAEIRLPEAIDRGLLCPFQYFGVTDTVDLSGLRWTRGGYDISELNGVYVGDRKAAEQRADHILRALDRYVTDIDEVKGLGFCVSVEHARFMAEYFDRCGVPSLALSGASPKEDRESAKEQLTDGTLRFIFVVDLYNEGVDIPEVNTVLFLRPTESLTIFLQQLGRGLRLAEGKECLTVLDFIGQANKKYDFEQKYAALLANTDLSVPTEIRRGFPALPAGCYIQLEEKAQGYILDNIRGALHSNKGLISRIESFEEDSGKELSLTNFCSYYRLDPREIYHRKVTFSRLCQRAHVRPDFDEPAEDVLSKAMVRFAAFDSRRQILFLLDLLKDAEAAFRPGCLAALSAKEQLMMEMFYITIWKKYAPAWDDPEVRKNLTDLAASPVMISELSELLRYRYDLIDFIDEPVDLGFACPLDLHCSYTRDQLFAALGYEHPENIREGVKWLPEKKIDVLLVTLNKSDRDYSPTTMYRDYSISDTLFHWQSQSTTSADSKTGQRYIHHREMGSRVLLFVREYKKDLAGDSMPYTFLGLADYLKHEGSRPMSITWKLRRPIPAKFLRKTNKLADS
jgi:superfamily II DNA or RNA helicase